jgi:hypothetical protein
VRRWLVVIAITVVVAAAFLHVLGAREYVGFLSGTPMADEELLVGIAYVLLWFGAILGAPIVIGAVCLDAACGTLATRLRAWRASARR